MAKRKIVLLVVEGTSDASLLVPAFSALIENRLFQGQEFHCDVLTAPNHREEGLSPHVRGRLDQASPADSSGGCNT